MTERPHPLIHIGQLIRPKPDHRHIFAFDDLMLLERIAALCPEPRFVTTARYLSKRFIINEHGLATLTPRRGSTVHGVIWEISDTAQSGLDIALGMPGIYDRYGSFARSPTGELIVSDYYGTRDRTPGTAPANYLQAILKAGRSYGFPAAYLDELAGWGRPCGRALSTTREG